MRVLRALRSCWALALAGAVACDGGADLGPIASDAQAEAASRDDGDPHAEHGQQSRSDAGRKGVEQARLRARGEYLVRHVSGCVECHSPRLPIGEFDESRLLSGVRDLVDLDPARADRGMLHAPNLTPDEETGLGLWSDDEIRNAFQHGRSRDDRVLHWTMPYWLYHDMTPEDADAVVAFLRSIPAVRNDLSERQSLPIELDTPYHLPDSVLFRSRLDPLLPGAHAAERGRYLAVSAGLCVFCHTPPADDPTVPLDLTRPFAGRRSFVPVRLGTPVEGDPPRIETRNLTPHDTGLAGWSARDVADTLRFGVNPLGLPVCEPMPSAFGGGLLGLTEEDALDIGAYVTQLRPIDSGEIRPCCATCHGEAAD
jgi:hypothetical protein